MSPYQTRAVGLTVALCALDGVDVFAITFAAPAIAAELSIGKAGLGLIFSAGLIGMALGSLLLAPLADLFGRRRVLLPSLALMSLGTAWTALSASAGELGASRFLTGLGVGTMIAVINSLAAEYSNERRRDTAVMVLNLGFPAGAVAAGLAASALLPTAGWRPLFALATGMGIAMLVVVARYLPESLPGLLARPGPTTLAHINRFLGRCGQPSLAALPATSLARRSVRAVLGLADRRTTMSVAAIYTLFVFSIYYIQSWIPSLIAEAGYSTAEAAIVSVWMNASGIVGGLALGAAVPRFGLRPVVAASLFATGVAIALFGAAPARLDILTGLATLVGFAMIGGMSNLYAVVSRAFPAAVRATGTGFVIGIGRIGSAFAPSIAGAMFAAGAERVEVSIVMAAPAVLAALMLARLQLAPGAPRAGAPAT